MTIAQLIALAANRLATLNTARTTAVTLGEVSRLTGIDADIAETQSTIDKLNTL